MITNHWHQLPNFNCAPCVAVYKVNPQQFRNALIYNMPLVPHGDPFGFLLEAVSKISQARYAMAGSYCLGVYEWLILQIHTAPWSLVKLGYLLCRYYPIIIVWPILFWAYLGEFDRETCSRMLFPTQLFLMPIVLPAQGHMLLRTDRRVLGLFIVSLAMVVAGLVWALVSRTIPPPALFYLIMGKIGCFPTASDSNRTFNLRVVLSTILIDTLCLAIVLWHCRGNAWAAITTTSRQTLMHTFVRQGLISYTTILVLNMSAIAAYFRPQNIPNQSGLPYAIIITNIMVKLREKALDRDTISSSELPSLRLPNTTFRAAAADQHK
ncbi:hypothetical protein BD779DRAFT_1525563 [Infundibulicybe gibba]|nr:hypothetical protein BD779DRAFT_1525563 [Infundibulicybe gibba]